MPPLKADSATVGFQKRHFCKLTFKKGGDFMKMYIKSLCIALCISFTMVFFSDLFSVSALGLGSAISYTASTYSVIQLFEQLCNDLGASLQYAYNCVQRDRGMEEQAKWQAAMTAYNQAIPFIKDYLDERYQELLSSADYENIFNSYESGELVRYIVGETPLAGTSDAEVQNIVNYIYKIYKDKADHYVFDKTNGTFKVNSNVFYNIQDSDFDGLLAAMGLSGETWINRDISVVDGKPQHVTSTYTPEVIDAFEYMGLKYTMLSSITDTHLYYRTGGLDSNYALNQYYCSFIIKNGNLYVLGGDPSLKGYFYSYYNSNQRSWNFFVAGYTPFSITSMRPYLPNNQSFEIKITEVDGRLCVAYYCFYVSSLNRAYEIQKICGYPQPTLVPILFERPNYSYDLSPSVSFDNYATDTPLEYINLLDDTDILSEFDILSGNFDTCGYIEAENMSVFNPNNSLGSAAKMLGEYSTPVSGGLQTNTSELSDLEKAIYALAQQQGIGYEQMLEQSKILIENGQLYIEGVDGIAYSLSSLTAHFDRLVEQGQFTANQAAATVEQLEAIIDYLKTLNIEGLETYIQQIEATLDDLKQGDKDREVLLGDILGQLTDLQGFLDSLGIKEGMANLSKIHSVVESISNIITEIHNSVRSYSSPLLELDPGDIIEHHTEQFPLFEQCKKLLNNLFNYNDIVEPPNFDFYLDMNNDGENELYRLIDLSILEITLSNENMVDKSWWTTPIKVIDLIRYLIAIVIYGHFIMRLIKRLPSFYGAGPFASM